MTSSADRLGRNAIFTTDGVRRGFAQGQALATGVLAYGIAFGALASQAKLSTLEAALMSAFVYSGSAQLAVLQGWSAAPLLLPAMMIIVMMNARYLLYGAALYPWLAPLPPRQVYPSLFVLGDANWILSMKCRAKGEADAGFVLGSGLAMYLPWVVGTMIGHVGGSAIGDPERFGLDFLLVAFSTAMMVDLWKTRAVVLPALAALVMALMIDRVAGGGWTIAGSGIAGGIVAFLAHRTE